MRIQYSHHVDGQWQQVEILTGETLVAHLAHHPPQHARSQWLVVRRAAIPKETSAPLSGQSQANQPA